MTVQRSVLKISATAVASITVVAAFLCLWRAWCEFPVYAWNEARLAPAFALRHGINPYPPLGGGPLSTWIYGPAGIAINLPATFAASAKTALHAACLINFVILIAPLAWIFFQLRNQQQGRSLFCFILGAAVLLIPRYSLVLQVADHTAVAFGILSCWFLTRTARPTTLDLSLAAGAGILASWSKQIEVFLITAQLVYLLLSSDRSTAVKYCLWVLLLGLLSLGMIVWYFGWDNLWLNLVLIPGRLPWTDDIPGRIAMRQWALAGQIVVPCAGLVFLRFSSRWPAGESRGTRFFLITVFAYVTMLPVGLAGFFKIGGDVNLLHSWSYLFPGCFGLWLASDKPEISARSPRIFIIAGACLLLRWNDIFSLPAHPFTAHIDSAVEIMAGHPHRLWFPRNPIITYYADERLWHSEDGVETRFLANYGIRESDFRRHLPPNLEGVVYPSTVGSPFSMALLSEFNQITTYPGWTLHTRAKSTSVQP